MAAKHVLAIDQGTTNTKALLFDEQGLVVARAARPVDVTFPQPGWVEQDGLALWRSVEAAIDDCLAQASSREIATVAITNQRESVLLWDRATGQPVGPVIVWQCRRTASFCDELRRDGMQATLESRTGLTIDPLFSATKIRWLLDAVPDARQRAADGALCAGTIDSWLLWNLTGGTVHACDATNASRTQLFNLRSADWDDELLQLFGIPRAVLPAVRPSSGTLGVTRSLGRLRTGTPIDSAIGDSHAALFGHAAFRPGSVKATYGTGSSLMTLVDVPTPSRHGLSTTVAWAMPGRVTYALEGNITVTGAAIDWLGQILGHSDGGSTVAELAQSVPDTGGVYLVPAFAGLGAPYWDASARGSFHGLTRGTTSAHLARAAIESIAYQVRDVFDAMAADVGRASALLADGGPSRNDALMQFQADVLACPVVRNDSANLSACGAAWLAGLAAGIWPSTDVLSGLARTSRRFDPRMAENDRARCYDGWRDAVSRTRTPPARRATEP